MDEVRTINMLAMALLVITLKTLKEQGVNSKVTGLDSGQCNLAYQLGMKYISRIT